MKKGLLIAVLLLAGCSFLRADDIQAFNVSGTFVTDGIPLSGTMFIDTTIGSVQSIDLFYGQQEFTYFTQGTDEPDFPAYDVFSYTTGDHGLPYLVLQLSSPELVGYQGGSLCSSLQPCPPPSGLVSDYEYGDPNNPSFNILLSGTVSLATPEPATICMMSTGLLAVLKRMRRR
jgi:hypothetical protein